MLVTFFVILLAILFLIKPLQKNPFFLIYFALMIGSAFLSEYLGLHYRPFSPQSYVIFLPFHILFINLMTVTAYGVDKKAAEKHKWRVPEMQLHLLELLGGTPGAFVAQKLFHHKTKKTSFRLVFFFVLAIQAVIVYYALKFLAVI